MYIHQGECNLPRSVSSQQKFDRWTLKPSGMSQLSDRVIALRSWADRVIAVGLSVLQLSFI